MFATYLNVFLKAIFTFIILLILTRLMGRKQLVQLTVIKKPQFRNTRSGDFNFKLENEYIVVELIMNGKIVYDNLKKINKTEDWLKDKVHIKNLKDDPNLKSIILAYLDSKNNAHVIYKN